jgi:MFS-type transporter involved in bile tolerance (Atg22 family)
MSENTSTETKKRDKFSKEEWSWIMYDWANSAFATIMLAAVFPVFFVDRVKLVRYLT